ncbi:ATP-binding cassette domain-containing protein [Candidatus Gracilibacteria bacterium]|nr:ATP-binding cassette domain-containing protein [Candidatus Gracilibacteria bacterium]
MLNPDLTAYDYISVSSLFYELEPQEIETRLHHLSELFEVTHRLHSLVRNLSLGETIKFEIIASIIHKPRVLFLDEPTIGLDFSSQSTIVSLLKQYHEEENVTILLTSHYAKDIQTLSKELLVIEKGKELYYDDINNLNSHPNRKVNSYLQTLNEELARYA